MIRDTARFHRLKWDGGQITLPQNLVKALPWATKEKLYVEYNEDTQTLSVSKLN